MTPFFKISLGYDPRVSAFVLPGMNAGGLG